MQYPVAYRRQAKRRAGLSNARLLRIDHLEFAARRAAGAQTAPGVGINVLVPANDNRKPGELIPFPKKFRPPPSQVLPNLLKRRWRGIFPEPGPYLIEEAAKMLDAAVIGSHKNPARVVNQSTACGFAIEEAFGGLRELYGSACLVLRGPDGPLPYTGGLNAAEYVRHGYVGGGLWQWERIRTYGINSGSQAANWPAQFPFAGVDPRHVTVPWMEPEREPLANPYPKPLARPLWNAPVVRSPVWPYELPHRYEAGNTLGRPEPLGVVEVVQPIAPRVQPPRVEVPRYPRPPGKHIKEAKLKLRLGGTTLGLVLNLTTEGTDIINGIFAALPAEVRFGVHTPQAKLWAIWKNFALIDWPAALQNILWAQLTDFVYGSIGGALQQATAGNPYWVSIGGLGTGPWDTPIK